MPTRYETVAGHVEELIASGAFRPGERVPSVRALSGQLKVSVTTVLEAYRLLEDRGVIAARPQSGYYVQGKRPAAPHTPRPRACAPAEVSVPELAVQVLSDSLRRDLVLLGGAHPHMDRLPVRALNQLMAAAARELDEAAGTYAPPHGHPELRVQVARRLLTASSVVRPEEVIITNGCQEALVVCLQAVCKPGDVVAVESPTYYGYLQALDILGLRALEIPTHPEHGLSLPALRLALEQVGVRAVLASPTFSNPTGACMDEAAREELAALLAEHEVPLIEDDVYGDLDCASTRPRPVQAFDRAGLVMLCSSFSKTLAPGYRIGWIVPGRFGHEVLRVKAFTSICTAALPQVAIARFLDGGGYDRHLRAFRRFNARQVAGMADAVARHFPPGTRCTRPRGGFLLWVEMPRGVDAVALYHAAVREGISVMPGPLFALGGRYRNYVRLNASYWSPETEEAVATLGRLAGR